MKLQPVITITWPDDKDEVHSIKISTTQQANYVIKEVGFWFYTQKDDLIVIHPVNVKKIRVSHKQVN